MRKIRKSFAVLAMMLSMCMVIPATVHANELAPDSTPTATIAPDETPDSSGEIPADPTASPEITVAPNETPVAEESASPEASALPEATPSATATPEAAPAVPIRRAPGASPTPTIPPLPAYNPMSVMKSGTDFNIAIKKLSGQTTSSESTTNTTIKAFIVTKDAPPEGAAAIDLNTFPTENGGKPLLAWFDSSTGTVYCQSTTPRTTLDGDCTSMFQNMQALKKVDFSWTQVAPDDMTRMFYNCRSLTTLDVSGWDTSNVTDMYRAFMNCSSLTNLNVSEWNTGKVENLNAAFSGCGSLTTLDVAKWNTGSVTNMSSMFYNCPNLATLSVSGWDTSNVTDMYQMFSNCYKLNNLDVSNWNTSSVTGMNLMFNGCYSLATLDVSKWDTSSVTDMRFMFNSCESLDTLDVSKWDTSKVTGMGSMFSGCKSLTALNVSDWKTGGVTNMSSMFYNCSVLTALDVSKWDTSKVTGMGSMFSGCKSLTALNVSGWNTGNVTNMGRMFAFCGGLAKLDVSKWNTSGVTNMGSMFQGCYRLTTLDLSGWNTSKATDMYYMFSGCSGLSSLDVSHFDTSNVTALTGMFDGCSGITSLDVSSFDTGKANVDSMFSGMDSLHTLKFGPKFVVSLSGDEYVPFPTPSKTASGAESNGKWGLNSEMAATSYDAVGLSTLGKTAGALTGTWYAQKDVVATVTFSPVNSDDVSDKLSGTMPAQTITGSGALNPVAYTVSDPYKLTFLGWTTEETSWRIGQANGRFYADRATYNAKDGDATLYAYYVPSDRVLKIRVLDLNGSPVSGVTVKYWIRFSNSYDAAANANKGTVVTDDTGYAADAKYRLVYYSTEDGVADRTDSWAGHYVIPTGGYKFQITSAPEGYRYYSGVLRDAMYGYDALTDASDLSAGDDYTLSKAAAISPNADGSYTVTLYVEKPATITYDANGGSGTMEQQTLSAAGPLNPLAFTRDGYWFTGWNTAKDGSGTAYADQAEFTPAGKDVTLYAQWKTGGELPEAGYPGDPSSRIVGPGIALFGVLMIAVMFSKDEK